MTETPDLLERRLAELAATGTADWLEVERRARRYQPVARTRRVVLIAAAALALFGAVAAASGLGERLLDLLTVSHTEEEEVPRPASVAYVSGDRLNRPGKPPLSLSAPLSAPLLGQYVPLAIHSPDGRSVAYHTWRANTPSLRVVDLRSGQDALLARGAQSLAWSDRIAYFRGARQAFRQQTAYVGRVVVADRPGSRSEVWTSTPAEYRVVAWAGRALLVKVDSCNVPPCIGKRMPEPGVYAMRGPERWRRLPLADVGAVSPDGRLVLGRRLLPGSDNFSSVVDVADVRSGRRIAALDLAVAGRGRLPKSDGDPLLSSATWRGNTIVGVASYGEISVLLVLKFDGCALRLDQVLRLDRAELPRARSGFFFRNPDFVGPGTSRVVVQLGGELRRGGHLSTTLTCDLARRSCVRGQSLRRWLAVVTNPSRPLG